ncbi:MAG: VWA domain-containing protein, partial [Phycisphaerae bacterium]|nr:VWA domain-containing protein [Phycisphaerae bacterium]
MRSMDFQAPLVLLLLVLLPVLGVWQWRRQRTAAVRFSSITTLKKSPVSWRVRLRPVLLLLRLLCLACVIVALARPRKGTVLSEISSEGIAIEAVVDRSGSMQAEMDYNGLELNRLDVVKRVLAEFIQGNKHQFEGRTGDLIGLITFAKYADTTCPLVLSHSVLLEFLKQTQIVTQEMSNEDGTAIGDAIALAGARLQKAEEEIQRRRVSLGMTDANDVPEGFRIKSKIIILLTDGRNNQGEYAPLKAAQLARDWGVKIYSIGIGSDQAFTTMQTPMGKFKIPAQNDLDENLLTQIAETTGGFYRRADSARVLEDIVKTINDLETSEVKTLQYTQYSEQFMPWIWGALGLIMLEILGSCTVFR